MKQLLLLVLFLSPALPGKISASSFIHRSGSQLVDSSGKPVSLNGVNLGGWLMWEAWIWGKGFVKETKVYDRIASVAGKEETENFRKNIYNNFISEADIRQIAANGFNVVRVPFNHRLLEDDAHPGEYKAEGWAVLDRLLTWCAKYKMYAVLDMHSAPGGNSGFFTADPDKKKLWQDEKNSQRTVALWQAIAKRYAENRAVAGYDLLNEPGFPDPKKLLQVYTAIITAVRAVDKNHLLLLEGNKLATDFSFFKTLPDENMALSYHLYTFINKKEENIRKKMNEYAAVSKKLDVPLWCGEWGENDFETLKLTQQVMREQQYATDGICIWTWKKAEAKGSTAPLNKISPDANWKQLIEWVGGNGPKPSPAIAVAGLRNFAEAVKMDRNETNVALLDMLRPRPVQGN